jgi:hypothetical protein
VDQLRRQEEAEAARLKAEKAKKRAEQLAAQRQKK